MAGSATAERNPPSTIAEMNLHIASPPFSSRLLMQNRVHKERHQITPVPGNACGVTFNNAEHVKAHCHIPQGRRAAYDAVAGARRICTSPRADKCLAALVGGLSVLFMYFIARFQISRSLWDPSRASARMMSANRVRRSST